VAELASAADERRHLNGTESATKGGIGIVHPNEYDTMSRVSMSIRGKSGTLADASAALNMKGGQGVSRQRKSGVKMLNRLPEGIGVTPDGRDNESAEGGAEEGHALPPALQEVIEAFQG